MNLTLTLDGRAVHAAREGDGEPVLLLHSAGSTLVSWSLSVGVLSQSFTTLAPDLPGFGASDPLPSPWTVRAFADFGWDLLDSLEMPRAHLIGNSFGALVAVEMAARRPERAGRLILIAPPPVDRVMVAETVLRLIHLIRDDGVARFETLDEVRLITPHAKDELLMLANANFAAARSLLPSLVAAANYEPPAIEAPVLVVWGAQDRLVPPAAMHGWLDLLPQAESLLLEQAGHCPQFDLPLELNPRMVRFLRG